MDKTVALVSRYIAMRHATAPCTYTSFPIVVITTRLQLGLTWDLFNTGANGLVWGI